MVKKRILIITPFNPQGIGGAETFVRELEKEVCKYCEVSILTERNNTIKWDNVSFLTGAVKAFKLLLLGVS